MTTSRTMTMAALLAFLVAGCATGSCAKKGERGGERSGGEMTSGEDEETIGVATMESDGTIVMQLRAEGDGGIVGDAMFTYAPDDPHYQEVLDHLGGMKPGEEKPVRPWPDQD